VGFLPPWELLGIHKCSCSDDNGDEATAVLSIFLPETLTTTQFLKKSRATDGTRIFSTEFTTSLHHPEPEKFSPLTLYVFYHFTFEVVSRYLPGTPSKIKKKTHDRRLPGEK
jgi:hypothetical protein